MTAPPARASSTAEVAAGKRFAFGRNWAAFLESLDEDRIASACVSLQEMLGVMDLQGKRMPTFWCRWRRRMLKDILLASWREVKRTRGMSAWRDVVDWVADTRSKSPSPNKFLIFSACAVSFSRA